VTQHCLPSAAKCFHRNHEHNQQHVTDLVDLNYVEQKIMTDQYDKFESFCSDIRRVFRNAEVRQQLCELNEAP